MGKMSLKFEDVKKILIPTDGSDHSMRAAEYGIGIAKRLGAEVVGVYVIDTVVLNRLAEVSERENVERELKQDGQRYINYIVGLAEKQGVKVDSVILKGHPFEEIILLTKELSIDLITMGTLGRHGADRILIGSVAERVIEFARCPVLVVK
jgi:nucleotide-binding universal stress UspA family protein